MLFPIYSMCCVNFLLSFSADNINDPFSNRMKKTFTHVTRQQSVTMRHLTSGSFWCIVNAAAGQ